MIIDELGRGTAPNEGVGISHAIAEELIRIKVFFKLSSNKIQSYY